MLSIKVKDIKNRQRFKTQELSKIQKKFLSKYFLNNLGFTKNSIKKSLLFFKNNFAASASLPTA